MCLRGNRQIPCRRAFLPDASPTKRIRQTFAILRCGRFLDPNIVLPGPLHLTPSDEPVKLLSITSAIILSSSQLIKRYSSDSKFLWAIAGLTQLARHPDRTPEETNGFKLQFWKSSSFWLKSPCNYVVVQAESHTARSKTWRGYFRQESFLHLMSTQDIALSSIQCPSLYISFCDASTRRALYIAVGYILTAAKQYDMPHTDGLLLLLLELGLV